MECSDCEFYPCTCESDVIRRDILTTILDLMHDKVVYYKEVMQNRVYMIKEDIISTISEETSKFQQVINSSISKLDNIVTGLQDTDETVIMTPEILEAMNFQLEFNLDSENIQQGFNEALMGSFVVFRELLKKNVCDEDEEDP